MEEISLIPFNKPLHIKSYNIDINHISGDGPATKNVNAWFKQNYSTTNLLTTSCTHALEMSALLLDIQKGDEIIAPSYTFVSTVNAFVLRGAFIKFVDIRPETMNINEDLIENAITDRTKAIVVVHYAGIACDMSKIIHIAKKYDLVVIEDAAQAINSKFNNKLLGTIGDFGTISYHETKNLSMGEGGSLLINNQKYINRAEIIREKGTNRKKFLDGVIDKYTWVDIGSSYLPSDINASILYSQLVKIDIITQQRLLLWQKYYDKLYELALKYDFKLPFVPNYSTNNGHMFYIRLKNNIERERLKNHLKKDGIIATSHYVPLHTSPFGIKNSSFVGEDIYTTSESQKLLRLPIYYDLTDEKQNTIIQSIVNYFTKGF